MRAAGLNTGHMAELVGEALARDGCLLFRARGCSMHPTIRHGETIVVQPVQSPRVKAGMVVLFRSPEDNLITHRIVDLTREGGRQFVTLRGDAVANHVDVVPVDQVLAEVVHVIGHNREVELDSGFQRFLGTLWARVPRLARLSLRLTGITGPTESDDKRLPLTVFMSESTARREGPVRSRVAVANLLVAFGKFIQSLALVVMKPEDLVEFGKRSCARESLAGHWGSDDYLAEGLNPDENEALEKLPVKQGDLLLMGMGGGRDAIALARAGFAVTGVDFVREMVEEAIQNASQRGLSIFGVVGEVSCLDLQPESYDVIWFSTAMYSSVPTRSRRVNMLKNLARALRSPGYLVCQFFWKQAWRQPGRLEFVRRGLSFLSHGRVIYQRGDTLWLNSEFLHAFSAWEDLASEFQDGGFAVVETQEMGDDSDLKWVLLKKSGC